MSKWIWHKIAAQESDLLLHTNNLLEIEVAGKRVCLAKHNHQLLACAATCPHAGATMANGYVDVLGNIVCPLHQYKFNLQTGKNVTGEGYFLKRFLVETRPDGVFLGFEEKNLFI
jgi:nitrite reductase/ring-hydroxylating ferredoxin subunit